MSKLHDTSQKSHSVALVGIWRNGYGYTGGYEAPGPDFDFDRPPNCMGVCLGACLDDGKCPFLGCPVLSSGCSPAATRH